VSDIFQHPSQNIKGPSLKMFDKIKLFLFFHISVADLDPDPVVFRSGRYGPDPDPDPVLDPHTRLLKLTYS
jgi:hypothetical protein